MFSKLISSKSVAIIIVLIFSFFYAQKISKTIKEKECFVAYDSYGYYMYLPHFFEKGSFNISKEWAEKRQYEYCDASIPVYQLIPTANGNEINIYHMGLAFVQLPSYAIAEFSAYLSGHKQDGFSLPYRIAYYLNTLFFIFLGIYYLRKLLRIFFTDGIVGLLLLMVYCGTNIYATFLFQFQLQHLYLFALNAMMLYYFFTFLNQKNKKHFILSAVIFGLTCFIRPTQAIWGIIPFILLYKELKFTRQFWKQIILYPLFAIIFNIPHVLYWKLIGGEFFMTNLHTEELILIDPNIVDFLFSFKKGWFIYSPIFLLIVPGLIYLYKNKRNLFWPLITFTILTIWILSSWECWWYASSFGSRVMVDAIPLMAILLGFGMLKLFEKKLIKIFALIFITLCIYLNIFQTYQFEIGFIHHERMTSEQYWYVFGKLRIDNYNLDLLEIDRGSLTWPQELESKKNKRLKFSKQSLLKVQNLATKPSEEFTVKRINLLDLVPNDETLVHVQVKAQTNDSTKSALLRIEMESKYNTYLWHSVELSLDKPKNKELVQDYYFNLAPIRHRDDVLRVFIDNKSEAKVKINSIEIKSTTLIRK